MIDKKYALSCRQSPLQKAMTYSENALRIIGTVQGLYQAGKQIYQVAAPIAETAASIMM